MNYRWSTEGKVLDTPETFVDIVILFVLTYITISVYLWGGIYPAATLIFLSTISYLMIIPRLLQLFGFFGANEVTVNSEFLKIKDTNRANVNWFHLSTSIPLEDIEIVDLNILRKRNDSKYAIVLKLKNGVTLKFGSYYSEKTIREIGVALFNYVPLSRFYREFCGIYTSQKPKSIQEVLLSKTKEYVEGKARDFLNKKFRRE